MAKIVVKGAYYGLADQTLYSVPSTKYAKVTIVYFGMENPSWNTMSNQARLFIRHVVTSSGLYQGILSGNFPYAAAGEYSTGQKFISRGTLGSEGTFMMPPLSSIRMKSSQYDWGQFYFLIEEIASTIIEG